MPPTTASWPCAARPSGLAGTARLTETRSAQALFERDSAIAHAGHRLAALDIAKDRLLVGRLDLADGSCLYVGRVAVADEHGDPLVVDWRAPAAEPFYRALPHDPMGVVRRRHFRWRHGELVGLDDEVFDVTAAGEAGLHLVGEGALMAALDAPRTGRMQDVVATIQAEQDVVIRRPRAGVTVVQGAPGTGKTAVALHRAAYLLYAERAHLSDAVLFVGPSTTFLRYVEDVVPSLGEDRVVLATPADLGPAVAVSKVDPPAAAAVKGDLRMVDVLARAVRAHERAPRAGIELWAGRFRLVVDHDDLAAIVATARRRSTTHNAGRPLVERLLLRALDAAYRNGLERDLRIGRIGAGSSPVRAAAPRRDRPRLRSRRRSTRCGRCSLPTCSCAVSSRRRAAWRDAGRDILTTEELDALHAASETSDGWSEADVALLDEADVLLGPVPTRRQRAGGADGRSTTSPSGSWRSGCRTARGAVAHSSTCPARRRAATGWTAGSARSRTPRPRSWVIPPPTSCTACTRSSPTSSTADEVTAVRPADAQYGHVVVDEAQDLSPMQWRAIARRCPTQSFTLAGDEAQAVRAGAAATWDRILEALGVAAGSVTRHELTVNYRTPAEVMELAGRLLEQFAPHLHPARSVRTAGSVPAASTPVAGRSSATDDRGRGCRHPARGRGRAGGGGRTRRTWSPHGNGDGEHLTAVDAKGLEFDGVVVVDPEAIVRESPGATGMARLYVALTRATTRLTILAPTPPGPPLDDVLGPFEPAPAGGSV